MDWAASEPPFISRMSWEMVPDAARASRLSRSSESEQMTRTCRK